MHGCARRHRSHSRACAPNCPSPRMRARTQHVDKVFVARQDVVQPLCRMRSRRAAAVAVKHGAKVERRLPDAVAA
eukprot:253384-Chlamydomonas_euryale.AAC.1